MVYTQQEMSYAGSVIGGKRGEFYIMGEFEKCEGYSKKIKLFQGLTTEQVSDILKRGHKMDFRGGGTIYHKGQLGSTVYIVLQGTVNISIEQHVIAKCRVGDAFGEMSALNHRPHCANAEAATNVKLFTINEKQMNYLLEKRVGIRLLLNIIHMISAYLENANYINAKNTRIPEGFHKDDNPPMNLQ